MSHLEIDGEEILIPILNNAEIWGELVDSTGARVEEINEANKELAWWDRHSTVKRQMRVFPPLSWHYMIEVEVSGGNAVRINKALEAGKDILFMQIEHDQVKKEFPLTGIGVQWRLNGESSAAWEGTNRWFTVWWNETQK